MTIYVHFPTETFQKYLMPYKQYVKPQTGVLYTPPPVVTFSIITFTAEKAISQGLHKIWLTTWDMFFGSRNLFFAVSQSYHVRVTSDIFVTETEIKTEIIDLQLTEIETEIIFKT